MLIPGLVSAKAPQLSVSEVIRLASETGLRAIEWAADGPIPVGDTAAAARAGASCRAAGITVCAYGTAYRAGSTDASVFPELLRTARALGARSIQVWAGDLGSSDASLADWARTVHALRTAVDAAGEFGIRVGLRYRRSTLADTLPAAQQLFREVSQDNLRASWQPTPGQSPADALTEFHALLPGLSIVELPGWPGQDDAGRSAPALAAHAGLWQPILGELAAAAETRYAMLTAAPDASPESVRRDAATLLSWLAPTHN